MKKTRGEGWRPTDGEKSLEEAHLILISTHLQPTFNPTPLRLSAAEHKGDHLLGLPVGRVRLPIGIPRHLLRTRVIMVMVILKTKSITIITIIIMFTITGAGTTAAQAERREEVYMLILLRLRLPPPNIKDKRSYRRHKDRDSRRDVPRYNCN